MELEDNCIFCVVLSVGDVAKAGTWYLRRMVEGDTGRCNVVANNELLLAGHDPQRFGVVGVGVATYYQVSNHWDFVLDRISYQLCLSAIRVVVYKAEECIIFPDNIPPTCEPPAFVTEDEI